jgi:hypothetical protein
MREFAPSIIGSLAGDQLGHGPEIITIAAFFSIFVEQSGRRT